MAIRYCGDVEIRMRHLGGSLYRVSVSTPSAKFAAEIAVYHGYPKTSSEGYDSVAWRILTSLERKNPKKLPVERDERGKMVLRRVFQAPCPR